MMAPPTIKLAIFNESHNRYLCGTGEGLAEQREVRNEWEEFTIEDLGNGNVAIKSFHGFYMSAQPDGKIEFDRTECQDWEIFKRENNGDGFTLLGNHGMYLCFGGQDGGVTCDRSEAGAWEIFRLK